MNQKGTQPMTLDAEHLELLRLAYTNLQDTKAELDVITDTVREIMASCAESAVKDKSEADEPEEETSEKPIPRHVEKTRMVDPDGFQSIISVHVTHNNYIGVSVYMDEEEEDCYDLVLTKESAKHLISMLSRACAVADNPEDVPDVPYDWEF